MLSTLDFVIFVIFCATVVGVGLFTGRKESRSGEEYFLAGRGLSWWLIGISLIAANISSEQFVGMNGSAAGSYGLAVASYDWLAAMGLGIVAMFILPRILRAGIYTMPEYLEYRYSPAARNLMSHYMVGIYTLVTIPAVLYTGGLAIHTIFDLNLTAAVWIVAVTATIYTTYGGLKSVAWADLLQGSALLVGGLFVMLAGLRAVGGWDAFVAHNSAHLHMILPADHPELPWTALLFGLWIPNLYYWGFNQYITQRTLAARNLRHGQLGVLMAGTIQLVLPLVIVVPGLMARQLYPDALAATSDKAYPLLIKNLIGSGLRGFVFAAIAGAVISTLASMLNSAATIFTIDVYQRRWRPDAPARSLVTTGRIATLVFMLIGCLIAPQLGRYGGIFSFMQDLQGFISPGILAAFLFGFVVKRTPAAAALTGMLINVPVYGLLHLPVFSGICFLNKMAITFTLIVLAMAAVTAWRPRRELVTMPVNARFSQRSDPLIYALGSLLIVVALALYVIWW
jgi:solute:Na+ symporter, SSS family